MIVPAMTMEEMKRDTEKDFPILQRKVFYQTKKIAKACALTGDKTIIRIFDYYSKHKNNWMYKSTISKRSASTSYLVWSYGEKGLNALMPFPLNESPYFFFTAHFFTRFNERLTLGLVKPIDIMHEFISRNDAFRVEFLNEVNPRVKKVFIANTCGVMLGHHNERLNVFYINTFLNHDMLKGDQVERAAQMSEKLDAFMKDY